MTKNSEMNQSYQKNIGEHICLKVGLFKLLKLIPL